MSVHTLKVIYPSLLFLFGSRENTPPVLFSSARSQGIPDTGGQNYTISPTEKGKIPAARFHSRYLLDSTATAIL